MQRQMLSAVVKSAMRRAASPASARAPGRRATAPATPPVPTGSTANNCAAVTASDQASAAAHPKISAMRPIDPHAGAGVVERIAAQPMPQRRRRDARRCSSPTVLACLERGQRARRAHQRQLAAQAVGAERHAQLGGALQRGVGHRDRRQPLARRDDLRRSLASSFAQCSRKRRAIAFERVAAAHHLDALRQVVRRPHFDRQAEPVEQLRPQLALFGVAAADQHEPRGMPDAQTFALDDILAGGGDIEQQIDQMILQQIGFVDVQEAAMRPRQQARLERLFALAPARVRDRARRRRGLRSRRAAGRPPAPAPARTSACRCLRVLLALVAELARAGPDRNCSGSRRRPSSSAATPPARAPPSTLPVPRSPNTSTPPTLGSTAAISSASFISSWPTIAENGNAAAILCLHGRRRASSSTDAVRDIADPLMVEYPAIGELQWSMRTPAKLHSTTALLSAVPGEIKASRQRNANEGHACGANITVGTDRGTSNTREVQNVSPPVELFVSSAPVRFGLLQGSAE